MNRRKAAAVGLCLIAGSAVSGCGPSENTNAYAYDCQEQLDHTTTKSTAEVAESISWQKGPFGLPVAQTTTGGGCQVLPSGAHAGYAHSSEGAMIAALDAVSSYNPSYNQTMLEEIDQKIAPGDFKKPIKETAARELEQKSEDTTLTGYSFRDIALDEYSEETARVSVTVGKDYSFQLATLSIGLQWVDGDWKIIPHSESQLLESNSSTEAPTGSVELPRYNEK